MIYIPFLAVAYFCAFLVAATVLIGLGLFMPNNFGSIFGTFLFLGCSALLAYMAEKQFPVRKKQQECRKEEKPAEAPLQNNNSQPGQIKLSSKLDTDLARKTFEKALNKGFMVIDGNHYRWELSKVLLAYMCGRIYCQDEPKCYVKEEKTIWKAGRSDFFPDSELNELFGVTDIGQSRQNRKGLSVPQGSNRIDKLFEQPS